MQPSMIQRRQFDRLQTYFDRNDTEGAERFLRRWLDNAEAAGDLREQIPVVNELMGLYRKLGREEQALAMADRALAHLRTLGEEDSVGAATTYLNCATVYKAFGRAEQALSHYVKAEGIYRRRLSGDDPLLAGLCNNMALALCDLNRFEEARRCYAEALSILQGREGSEADRAITHLNLASCAEGEWGLEAAQEEIALRCETAVALLDAIGREDGYCAFVCEKCASVLDYYGYFYDARRFTERARRIYEGNGAV